MKPKNFFNFSLSHFLEGAVQLIQVFGEEVFHKPVLGETSEDTVKTDIAVIKTEVKNLNKKIDDKFESLNGKFESLEKRFDGIEKNFDRQNNIIIACIGIPLAILAIGATVWGILAHGQSGKDRALERQIEVLTQEIETLKQRRIAQP